MKIYRLFVLLGCLGWGCGADASSETAVEVRDSAGIRIVTNGAPASPEPWTVALEPYVVIGGDESDTTQILYRVEGGVALSDGRIVVAQGPAPMVRWYDAMGNYVTGTGRPGGGPGEFGPGEGAWIMELWPLPGDSVATWEHSQRRMQVFDPDGRYARAVVLELPPAMPPAAYPQIVGRLDNGFIAFLIEDRRADRPVGHVRRDSMMYMRYRGDGSYAGDIARLPGFVAFTRMFRLPNGNEVKADGRPPFAMAPAAQTLGDVFVYGSQERWEIAVRDTTGVVRTLVRRHVARQAVSADMIATDRAQRMERAPQDPAQRREWQESVDNSPYPDSLPAHRLVRADRGGMLWVQEYYAPGADSAAWSVFDTDGRWVADVTIPTDWRILDIGEDYLLVLVTDELDVETVRRHGLTRH